MTNQDNYCVIMGGGIGTVSYTHLDVYKRQVQIVCDGYLFHIFDVHNIFFFGD